LDALKLLVYVACATTILACKGVPALHFCNRKSTLALKKHLSLDTYFAAFKLS